MDLGDSLLDLIGSYWCSHLPQGIYRSGLKSGFPRCHPLSLSYTMGVWDWVAIRQMQEFVLTLSFLWLGNCGLWQPGRERSILSCQVQRDTWVQAYAQVASQRKNCYSLFSSLYWCSRLPMSFVLSSHTLALILLWFHPNKYFWSMWGRRKRKIQWNSLCHLNPRHASEDFLLYVKEI